MMSIYDKRDGPMILRKCERRAVMGVRLFAAGIVLASFNCLHSPLEHVFGFSQVMEQSGKFPMAASAKPTGENFSELCNT